MNRITQYFNTITNAARRVSRRYWIGAGILVVFALLGLNYLNRAPSTESAKVLPRVTISSVAGLSSNSSTLPVTGVVTSLSQATILAQNSGGITRVYAKLGDRVAAGGVIARFEASSQSAAVTQAQGAYDAAQAQLQKVKAGSTLNQKDISEIQEAQAARSVANLAASAITSIQGGYSTLDDALHAKADVVFSNPLANPKFILRTPDSQTVINIENARPIAEQKLTDYKNLSASLSSSSDIDASLSRAIADLQYVLDFMGDVSRATNTSIPATETPQATINAHVASVNAGRSAISGVIAALNGARSSYDAAVASAAVADKQNEDTSSGGRAEDIAAAEANLKQALGALNAAQANLEKTVIRSPISGTIVTLPIKTGDYVTAFSQAAIVSNPQALEIVTNVTSSDAKTLRIGGKALIGETSIPGVITRIAPAIDPTTGKIEVRIGINGDISDLADGESVSVVLDRSDVVKPGGKKESGISIPIVSVKMTPQGPVVFTLAASSTLAANPVTLGTIQGDRVEIVSGLTPDMTIVADARGRADGEQVVVAE